MVEGEHLKCTICGTEIEVPLCCEREMNVSDGTLRCMLCNTKKQISICCGKKNVMITKAK